MFVALLQSQFHLQLNLLTTTVYVHTNKATQNIHYSLKDIAYFFVFFFHAACTKCYEVLSGLLCINVHVHYTRWFTDFCVLSFSLSEMASKYCDACHSWQFSVKECAVGHENRCGNCIKKSKHTHPRQQHQQQQQDNIKPIFHPTLTIHSHLSFEKRAAIVAFHRIGMDKYKIMKYLACSMPTVNRWIKHYNQYFNVTHT